MRKNICDALVNNSSNPKMVFLTSDLGFMALEPLQKALGSRFINAGVSEQNMMSVAAAMAKDGWQPWCYSIAPFCFARPFEQIRNDICLHNLPVKLLGNGGGYGYGVMGPTHHAVDDYAVLLALPNMKVFVPCFNEDIPSVIDAAITCEHPSYIRLGVGELPTGRTFPIYKPWRQVLNGDGPVVISIGPISGSAWASLMDLPQGKKPDLWILSELPVAPASIPVEILSRLSSGTELVVIEEHIAHGSAGSMLAHRLLSERISVSRFTHLTAAGLALDGVYGSQKFLRQHSGLSPENIKNVVSHQE